MPTKRLFRILGLIVFPLLVIIVACKKANPLNEDANLEWFSGGKQTTFNTGSGAFGSAFEGLSASRQAVHDQGDAAFEATFNSDASQLNSGLGPIFNNQACTKCHVGDGRGKAPNAGENLTSLLLRISIPGFGEHGSPNPVPNFGGQLQQRGIFGVQPEADISVAYEENTYTFPDGETYSLRKPIFTISNPYTGLPGGMLVSPRMASPVFGLGLLEAISDANIKNSADVNDADGDGISGKANSVWDVMSQSMKLGRFGWKAGQPSIIQQSAGAYVEDMGVTNFIFPRESTYGQPQYNYPTKYDLSDSTLFTVAFYIKTLQVPARRNLTDAKVKAGKDLFAGIGCVKCHTPRQKTKIDVSNPELSNQTIFPFTDMLLHDMGDGLKDNREEFAANGYEWRTPPLWGIGLTNIVNGHNNFLHDGRARNFKEAIMWHGGEAEAAKNAFKNLSALDRNSVLAFLNSL